MELNNLIQIVNFPTWIRGSHTRSPVVLDLFLSSDPSIWAAVAFLSSGNFLSCSCLGVYWTFFKLKKEGGGPFRCTAFDYYRANWNCFRDHLRDVLREKIFNLGASAAAFKFCLVELMFMFHTEIDVNVCPTRKLMCMSHSEIDVYVPHNNYVYVPNGNWCACPTRRLGRMSHTKSIKWSLIHFHNFYSCLCCCHSP